VDSMDSVDSSTSLYEIDRQIDISKSHSIRIGDVGLSNCPYCPPTDVQCRVVDARAASQCAQTVHQLSTELSTRPLLVYMQSVSLSYADDRYEVSEPEPVLQCLKWPITFLSQCRTSEADICSP
jgi:hypothetical protein